MRTKSPDTMNKIKEYVERYYFERKTSPSIREIAGGIGIGKTTVFRYLQDMSENGMITYDGESITTEKTNKLVTSTVSIPIVGRIACGTPNLAGAITPSLSILSIIMKELSIGSENLWRVFAISRNIRNLLLEYTSTISENADCASLGLPAYLLLKATYSSFSLCSSLKLLSRSITHSM